MRQALRFGFPCLLCQALFSFRPLSKAYKMFWLVVRRIPCSSGRLESPIGLFFLFILSIFLFLGFRSASSHYWFFIPSEPLENR